MAQASDFPMKLGSAMYSAGMKTNTTRLMVYDRGFAGHIIPFLHQYFDSNCLIRIPAGFSNTVKAFVKNGKRQTIITDSSYTISNPFSAFLLSLKSSESTPAENSTIRPTETSVPDCSNDFSLNFSSPPASLLKNIMPTTTTKSSNRSNPSGLPRTKSADDDACAAPSDMCMKNLSPRFVNPSPRAHFLV